MWYPPKVVTPPTDPITVDEAKAHCVVLHADDDGLFEAYIAAARDYVEKYLGTPLAEQHVEIRCDSFRDFASFPVVPVSDVEISYVDTAGASQSVADDAFELRSDGLQASIVPAYGRQWPVPRNGSRITVTATVGYETLPPAVKHAMLLWIGDAYETRENKAEVPWTAFDALLCNYRV